jgi:hypothetical protein
MSWSKRIRSALLLALAWAVAWAPIALALGVLVIDPDNSMDEMWPLIGAYPGFLCGLLFAGISGVRGRSLRDVSLARAVVLGAVSGLLVSGLPSIVASTGDGAWTTGAMIIGAITLMSAFSAIVSALLAKRSNHRRMATA